MNDMNEWISVLDALPEINIDVLVFKSDGIGLAFRSSYGGGDDKKWWWVPVGDSLCCGYDSFDDNVTHWMPLPRPPIGPGYTTRGD